MAYKKYRDLKVYEKYTQREVVPEIRLQGKWLEELDFAPGTPIVVQCQGGKLVITKKDEVM
ncbi:MAG: SymE family type I addiction module toxin [Lachnospiraceae bacterium]|nr:SymE family type I addiction module toxin [Lachnospiraceae bacterium]